MKSVRESAFHILVVKSPKMVVGVATVWKALDDTRRSQIRLPSTPTASESLPLWNDLSLDALRTIIRDVVRKELEHRGRLAPPPASSHDFKLQSVIPQELTVALTPTRAASAQPSYLDVGGDANSGGRSNGHACSHNRVLGAPT